jgi:hypothetical protein
VLSPAHSRIQTAILFCAGHDLTTSTIMNNITFGLTMLLVGMGGTLLTLWFLAILISWLTRFSQSKEEGGKP